MPGRSAAYTPPVRGDGMPGIRCRNGAGTRFVGRADGPTAPEAVGGRVTGGDADGRRACGVVSLTHALSTRPRPIAESNTIAGGMDPALQRTSPLTS